MSPQDCDNCYYPAPNPKKEQETTEEKPSAPLKDEEDCPQCFYEGELQTPPAQTDDCPQCFYQPEGEQEKQEETEDCPQCFYRPEGK